MQETTLKRVIGPPVGGRLLFLSLVTSALLWGVQPPRWSESNLVILATACFLTSALSVTYRFPIRIAPAITIYISGLPVFVAVCLLPPRLTWVTVSVGATVGMLWIRQRNGGYVLDALVMASMVALAAELAGVVAHEQLPWTSLAPLPYLGAAGVLLIERVASLQIMVSSGRERSRSRMPGTDPRLAVVALGVEVVIAVVIVIASLVHPLAVALVPAFSVLMYSGLKHALDEDEAKSLLWAEVAHSSPDGVLILDFYGTIITANARAAALYGYGEPPDLVGLSLAATVLASDRHRMLEHLRTVQRTGILTDVQYTGYRRDGSTFEAEMSFALMPPNSGGTPTVTCMVRDITLRKQVADDLQRRALYDALTRIPNRVLFDDRLQQAVMRAHRDNLTFAVLMIDLNHFKQANDIYGHQCGDYVLQETSLRLQRVLRESDTVARLGGDEFAILLPKADAVGSTIVAGRIQDAIAEPYLYGDHDLGIGASIGVALFGANGDTVEDLMREADAAMYATKRAGTRFSFAPFRRGIAARADHTLAS